VVEAEWEWSHGRSVALGLLFALWWSGERRQMLPATWNSVLNGAACVHLYQTVLGSFREAARDPRVIMKLSGKKGLVRIGRQLSRDKKSWAAQEVRFIFVRKPGNCVTESVSVHDAAVAFQYFLTGLLT
jgi:3-dehydroquinate synthase